MLVLGSVLTVLCAQDSRGTEPQTAVTTATETQPAGAQDPQNTHEQTSGQPAVVQIARAEVPNGTVNASSDRSATMSHTDQVASGSIQPAPAAGDPVSASTSSAGVNNEEVEKSKDAEKDGASMNTSTHTYARSQSTRQKETKSVSELAHTASSTANEDHKKTKSASSKKARVKGDKGKSSLFSRLFHVFVPCVGPSSKAHSIEIDEEKRPPVEPAVPPTVELKEKQVAKEEEEVPPKLSTSETVPLPEEVAGPSEEVAVRAIPPPLQPLDVPAPSDDPAVVVPPTPTRTLSKEEGGGVLSGSVQPIGSTGDDLAQEHRDWDPDDESDGSTSITDEEHVERQNIMDEAEDEEEQLILNGGAGIPVGPVRTLVFLG